MSRPSRKQEESNRPPRIELLKIGFSLATVLIAVTYGVTQFATNAEAKAANIENLLERMTEQLERRREAEWLPMQSFCSANQRGDLRQLTALVYELQSDMRALQFQKPEPDAPNPDGNGDVDSKSR